MNKETQLPPELVEKMHNIVRKWPVENTMVTASKCAQIAVDYADGKTIALKSQRYELTMENKELKQFIGMILKMDEERGREGCTYGDTNFDSSAACHGHNELLNYLKTKAKQLLKTVNND